MRFVIRDNCAFWFPGEGIYFGLEFGIDLSTGEDLKQGRSYDCSSRIRACYTDLINRITLREIGKYICKVASDTASVLVIPCRMKYPIISRFCS
jgi:hypothetical protein